MGSKMLGASLVIGGLLTGAAAHGGITFESGTALFEGAPGGFQLVPFEPAGPFVGPYSPSADYDVPDNGFGTFIAIGLGTADGTLLTVDGGSVLGAGNAIFALDSRGIDGGPITDSLPRRDVLVTGAGSVLELGSSADPNRLGAILMRGRSELRILDGAVVRWRDTSDCGPFCNVLIGQDASSHEVGVIRAASNAGISVEGAGSLLDASNTGGRFVVGESLGPLTGLTDEDSYLVVVDGAEVRSQEADVAYGVEYEGDPVTWDGNQVLGLAVIAGQDVSGQPSTWTVRESGPIPGENDTNLNVGLGDGATGLLAVISGGRVDVLSEPGESADMVVGAGSAGDGFLTDGGSSLVILDGPGSTLNIDSSPTAVPATDDDTPISAVLNGYLNVHDGAQMQMDSSLLVITGNGGAPLDGYLASKPADINTALGAQVLTPTSYNLDVSGGSSVTITDGDDIGVSALVIGQRPSLPGLDAQVRITDPGSVVQVINASTKPLLSATVVDIPAVSNIGVGDLVVQNGAELTFTNGDFVVGAGVSYDAVVDVDNATLTADRIVIGLTDYEGAAAAPGDGAAVLKLTAGTLVGDVIVDDNGALRGTGTINGTLIGDGGTMSVGLSPGTLVVESLVLNPGTVLELELAVNPDGSIDAAGSDLIVATEGDVDLSAGSVQLTLVTDGTDADGDGVDDALQALADSGEPISLDSLIEAETGDVVAEEVAIVDESGQELTDVPVVFEFIKQSCKDGGWESLLREDASEFSNQGDCVEYVNTGT